MKFIIKRISAYKEKPCDRAVKAERFVTEKRSCTEEYFDKEFSEWQGKWRSKGKNHTVDEKGWIQREIEEECFIIELNTLEELVDFVKEIDEEVIIWTDRNGLCFLEINDDD